MTKSIVTVENPRSVQLLRAPVNSILAVAQTAHDLETAHRKAAKAKAFRRAPNHASLDGEFRPITSVKRRHGLLIPFVLRMVRLVAVRLRGREKNR
jgi:hypothetical protein